MVGLMLFDGYLFAQDRTLVEELKKALMPGRAVGATPSPADTSEPMLVMHLEFSLNSAELTPEAVRYLGALGIALTEGRGMRSYIYRVEGHSCSQGSPQHNDWLSRQRAQAVVDYLVRHFSLQREQFHVIGHGENKPIAPNTTEEGRGRNRRVVIVNTLDRMEPPAPGKLELDVQVKYVRAGKVEELPNDATLTQRDGYAVEFTPRESAYIYVCQVDSNGKTDRLFPNEHYARQDNPATPGTFYRVPELGRWFYLDEYKGREHIVVLAHREELKEPTETCRNVLGEESKLASRGVGGIREEARKVGGIRTRQQDSPEESKALEPMFVWKRSFLHQ
jgi:outer membrane protein OmpA-like peptidoglycan-associated protein